MKKTFKGSNVVGILSVLCTSVLVVSCKKSDNSGSNNSNQPGYQQITLVADVGGTEAEFVDKDLLNPWGLAFGPTGIIWISGNHSGVTTVYNSEGSTILPAVAVPFRDQHRGGAPTGVVYNNTNDFTAAGSTAKSVFIYATENGTISVWNGKDSTITVADRSSMNAVYKGIALCRDGEDNFIYIADFRNGKIDVLDKNFNYVNKPFSDPDLPDGYAPFNIKAIGGKLFVAYAKQMQPDKDDDERGSGNGYVDIFNPDGSFVKRFASQGSLNSPWGLAQIPSITGSTQHPFGIPAGSILVGNFGDGRINVYDISGTYTGQLMRGGTPLTIEGLWEISFEDSSIPGSDPNRLYFTAGTANEAHGLFGYVFYRN